MTPVWKYFSCRQCGRCCKSIGLPYNPVSIFKISQRLRLSAQETISKYYGEYVDGGRFWESNDKKRTPCPFLKSDFHLNVCEIYDVRPEGCQAYPIDTDCGPAGVACPGWDEALAKLRAEQEAENDEG